MCEGLNSTSGCCTSFKELENTPSVDSLSSQQQDSLQIDKYPVKPSRLKDGHPRTAQLAF